MALEERVQRIRTARQPGNVKPSYDWEPTTVGGGRETVVVRESTCLGCRGNSRI